MLVRGRGYTKNNAADAALSLELYPWPPDCPMAQSLSAMAHRNLYRRQDDANRVPRILGIPVDGAHEPMALPEVDRGDGSPCPSRGQEILARSICHSGSICHSARSKRPLRPLTDLPSPHSLRCLCPLPSVAPQIRDWLRLPENPCCRESQKPRRGHLQRSYCKSALPVTCFRSQS